MVIKVATWTCVWVFQTKHLVKQLIISENIEVLCMQETEADINFDTTLLSFQGFNFENEINTCCAMIDCHVASKINYVRRHDRREKWLT
jgi:hypothetical protein